MYAMLRYILVLLCILASYAGPLPFPYFDCTRNKSSEVVIIDSPLWNASWTCFNINSIPSTSPCRGRCCKVPYQYLIFDTRLGCRDVITEIVLHHTVQGHSSQTSNVPQFYQYKNWQHVFKVKLGNSPIRPTALKSICFSTTRPITDRSKPCRRKDTYGKFALLDKAQKCCPVQDVELKTVYPYPSPLFPYEENPVYASPPPMSPYPHPPPLDDTPLVLSPPWWALPEPYPSPKPKPSPYPSPEPYPEPSPNPLPPNPRRHLDDMPPIGPLPSSSPYPHPPPLDDTPLLMSPPWWALPEPSPYPYQLNPIEPNPKPPFAQTPLPFIFTPSPPTYPPSASISKFPSPDLNIRVRRILSDIISSENTENE